MSQPMGKTEFSSTAKIEQILSQIKKKSPQSLSFAELFGKPHLSDLIFELVPLLYTGVCGSYIRGENQANLRAQVCFRTCAVGSVLNASPTQ